MIHGTIRGAQEGDAGSARKHPVEVARETGVPTTFFTTCGYTIAGKHTTLDEIEHGVLRCNTPGPGKTELPFAEDDERREWYWQCESRADRQRISKRKISLPSHRCMPELDPRIHFALVCGAKGCPAIQVYNPKNLERGLDAAARNFLKAEIRPLKFENEAGLLTLESNMLLKWYGGDFGASEAAIARWILQKFAARSSSEEDIKAVFGISEADFEAVTEVKFEFRAYDWSVNGS